MQAQTARYLLGEPPDIDPDEEIALAWSRFCAWLSACAPCPKLLKTADRMLNLQVAKQADTRLIMCIIGQPHPVLCSLLLTAGRCRGASLCLQSTLYLSTISASSVHIAVSYQVLCHTECCTGAAYSSQSRYDPGSLIRIPMVVKRSPCRDRCDPEVRTAVRKSVDEWLEFRGEERQGANRAIMEVRLCAS